MKKNVPTGVSASGDFIIAVIATDSSATGCNAATKTVVFGPLP